MVEIEGRNGTRVGVVKDSISGQGHRMTTFELEYPRMIHGEFMTHRDLSKNASSSRAIPIPKAIENVLAKPAFPVHWGKAQVGMQADEELTGEALESAKALWQRGIDQSIELVREFGAIGAHKQIAARWLETGQFIKVVASGTNWDNLLWLRNDEAAQPEFRVLAECIQRALDESVPTLLKPGQWHLPYVESNGDQYFDSGGEELSLDLAQKISASCCAQVSYRRLNDDRTKALDIFSKLFSGRKLHLSPTEHQGTPINPREGDKSDFNQWTRGITHIDRSGILHSGNLTGRIQYRQTLPNNVYVKPVQD